MQPSEQEDVKNALRARLAGPTTNRVTYFDPHARKAQPVHQPWNVIQPWALYPLPSPPSSRLFLCGFHMGKQFSGQILLHLVELRRTVSKGNAHVPDLRPAGC